MKKRVSVPLIHTHMSSITRFVTRIPKTSPTLNRKPSKASKLLAAESPSFEFATPATEIERQSSTSSEISSKPSAKCGHLFKRCGRIKRKNQVDNEDSSPTTVPAEPYEYSWESAAQSACVKFVLHIGASPLVLAPGLCWRYGGIVAFVPVIFLAIGGALTLHFLESFTGHYTRKSTYKALSRLAPLLRSLGLALLLTNVLMAIHYMQFVAWVLLYFYHAWSANPQWEKCDANYNSVHCYSEALQKNCTRVFKSSIYFSFRCMSTVEMCRTGGFVQANSTHCWGSARPDSRLLSARLSDPDTELAARTHAVPLAIVSRQLPAETDFFQTHVAGSSTLDVSLDARENHHQAMMIAYTIGWLLLLLPCLSLRRAATLTYCAAIVAPMLLFITTFRVLTLPGAFAGVSHLFTSHSGFSAQLGMELCADATLLAFTGVGVGSGTVTSLASRDRHRTGGGTPLLVSSLVVAASLGQMFLSTVLVFASHGHALQRLGVSLPRHTAAEEVALVTLSAVLEPVSSGGGWGVLCFGALALHSIVSLALIVLTVELNVMDALTYFGRRPLHISALAIYTAMFVVGELLVLYAWPELHHSVTLILHLQWTLGLLALSVALGLKMLPQRRVPALAAALGKIGDRWKRFLRVGWLLVCPLAAVALLMVTLTRLRSGNLDKLPMQTALGWSLALLPPIASFASCFHACESVPVWALLSDSPRLESGRASAGEIEAIFPAESQDQN